MTFSFFLCLQSRWRPACPLPSCALESKRLPFPSFGEFLPQCSSRSGEFIRSQRKPLSRRHCVSGLAMVRSYPRDFSPTLSEASRGPSEVGGVPASMSSSRGTRSRQSGAPMAPASVLARCCLCVPPRSHAAGPWADASRPAAVCRWKGPGPIPKSAFSSLH